MKNKRILALLAAMVLLASCTKVNVASSSQNSSSVAQSSSEMKSENAIIQDESGNLTATSLAGVAQLYTEGKISENAFAFFDYFLSGGDYNYKFLVSNFKLTYNEQAYADNKRLALDFTIDKSELKTLPVGSYEKDFYDIRFETIVERGQAMDYYKESEFADKDAVKRLKQWFGSTYSYLTPNAAQPLTSYGSVVNYICNFYGNGVLSLEEFAQYAEQDFGIKPYEITDWNGLFYKDDSGNKMVQAGGLGGGVAYEIINCEDNNGKTEVTVQFFGDYANIKPSYLIKYFFNGSSFAGYEIPESSPYPPIGFMKNIDLVVGKYTDKIENIDELRTLNPYIAAIIEGDFQKLSENSLAYTPELLQAVEGFEVQSVTDIYADEYAESVKAKINISSSNNPNYPVGEHIYEISTGIATSVRRAGEISPLGTPVLMALSSFIKTNIDGNYTLDGLASSEYLTEYILLRLNKMYPHKNGATKDDIAAYAKKYFGLSNYEPKGVFYEEGGIYTVLAHGGGNAFYNITITKGAPEFPEILVQFYADSLKLVRSHEIRYSLQLLDGDYKFLSAEILNKSEFEPGKYAM